MLAGAVAGAVAGAAVAAVTAGGDGVDEAAVAAAAAAAGDDEDGGGGSDWIRRDPPVLPSTASASGYPWRSLRSPSDPSCGLDW